MLPVALQDKNRVITNEFIVSFSPFKKRVSALWKCALLYALAFIFVGVSLYLRMEGPLFVIVLNSVILFVLLSVFCIYRRIHPKKKIPLLLPLEPAKFKLYKAHGFRSLGQLLFHVDGYEYLHPVTIELLNKLYNPKQGLYVRGFLSRVKKGSELAAFISAHVPIKTYVATSSIPELLAQAFVLAAYGQFSSVYPEHILIAAINEKPSYKFYLAALLSIFENTFVVQNRRFVVTKPLLYGVNRIIESKKNIINIKGPKYVGKTAVMYLFARYFANKKFNCAPVIQVIDSKADLEKIPKVSLKPRIIILSRRFKKVPFEKLGGMLNALVFVEDIDTKHHPYKKYMHTIKLPTPDIYDLFKLAIFWDINGLLGRHYKVDDLFRLVEKSLVMNVNTPQPYRLFSILTEAVA